MRFDSLIISENNCAIFFLAVINLTGSFVLIVNEY